jgi:hypothetical protein
LKVDSLTKDILLKFDEQDRYETPSDFRYEKLKSQVESFSKDLENNFGLNFKIDNHVQDASFYGDVIIPHELITEPKSNYLYSIRISNFGGLATLTSSDVYSDSVKAKIKDSLAKHNFTYIESDILQEDYDGSFDKFYEIPGGQKPSWWIRYFDYL